MKQAHTHLIAIQSPTMDGIYHPDCAPENLTELTPGATPVYAEDEWAIELVQMNCDGCHGTLFLGQT